MNTITIVIPSKIVPAKMLDNIVVVIHHYRQRLANYQREPDKGVSKPWSHHLGYKIYFNTGFLIFSSIYNQPYQPKVRVETVGPAPSSPRIPKPWTVGAELVWRIVSKSEQSVDWTSKQIYKHQSSPEIPKRWTVEELFTWRRYSNIGLSACYNLNIWTNLHQNS